jgi:DNA-binding response OmpR family regulator
MSRVLIVEDDVDVRDWIAHCMLQDGYELRGVTDARRLRALHEAEPDYRPDLVLMDYALPDTDGVTLLSELHGYWPDVPAVFVTVQWTGEIIERIAGTGSERVAKPFNPDDLRAAARRALAARRSEG